MSLLPRAKCSLSPTNCLVPLPNAMAEAATFWPHAHSVTPYDDTESKAAHTKDAAAVLCPLHALCFVCDPRCYESGSYRCMIFQSDRTF